MTRNIALLPLRNTEPMSLFMFLKPGFLPLFQQCSQLKLAIHFHLAKPKSTNIQIPINNMQSQGVKITLMSPRIKLDLSQEQTRSSMRLSPALSHLA